MIAWLLRKLRRKAKPKGPAHKYSSDVYLRGYNHCTKCGVYNPRRQLHTQPPCSERLPSVILEMP